MLQISKVEVNWHERYANTPSFVVTVDGEVPAYQDIVFDYVATGECRGLIRGCSGIYGAYLAVSDRPGAGFGGATYDITFRDGMVKRYVGPFSSRACVINRAFPHEDTLVDVTIVDSRNYLLSGALTLTSLKDWITDNPDCGVGIVEYYCSEDHEEIWFQPTLNSVLKSTSGYCEIVRRWEVS